MTIRKKKAFPLSEIRRYLEPGPIVLVSSHWKGQTNIMTMGWHMMLGFSPALLACYIWNGNHSFDMIRRSGECVIDLPTVDMVDTVVGIGNCSGEEPIDKFERFALTAEPATHVEAPLITECYANFECKVRDDRQVDEYGMFILEVVGAHVSASPKRPETLHYRGQAEFMVSGGHISRRAKFKPQNL